MRDTTKKLVETACRMYRAGMSKKEIAEEILCMESSVNHYLELGGIVQAKRIDSAIPTIIQMRKEGKGLSEISKATGFNKTTISIQLQKRGLGYHAHDLDVREPVIDLSTLTYAERKPKIYSVEYAGKKYWDITELCGI